MSSLDAIQVRKGLGRGIIVRKGTDAPVAIRLRNKAGLAVTSVTVVTGTSLALIDSAGTTTLLFATYTTIGAVVDALNATSSWEAKTLDSLRSDASVSRLLDGAITASGDGNGVTGYDVLLDTSTALEIVVCLSPFRDWDAPKGHRVNLKRLKYGVNMGTAAVDSANLYKRLGNTETKVFGDLSVDTTVTTELDFTSSNMDFYGRNDEEFIFLVKDAATLADATSNYVEGIAILE